MLAAVTAILSTLVEDPATQQTARLMGAKRQTVLAD